MLKLTPGEERIIEAALKANNPGIFTNFFIRNKSETQLVYPTTTRHAQYSKHWKALGEPARFSAESAGVTFWVKPRLEENVLLFEEQRGYIPLPWQLEFWQRPEKTRTVIGLTGTGKTLGIGMLAMYACATMPYFRFLNVAPNMYQSALMEREIKSRIEESHFRTKFLKPGKAGIRYRPYIMYTFENGSTAEFMNVADNADNVQSWSGDWINLDEAGLLDQVDYQGQVQLAHILIGLSSRLRGERPDGRPRLGLLSMISMAYANDTLWTYFDQGKDDSQKRSWSRKVFHADNPYLTEEYLQKLRDTVPPGMEGMWLRGEPPPRTNKEFSDAMLDATLDTSKLEFDRTQEGVLIEETNAGVVTYELPKRKNGVYVLTGDPGLGEPPARNAPVIVCMDVTDFPREPATLAAFWWGYSGGKYQTFIESFARLATKYGVVPDFRGYDSTGAQRALAELAFTTGEMPVIPMDFAGSKKIAYLSALKLLMGKGKWRLPAGIYGIKDQLRKYVLPDNKLPQDIVCALAMNAYLQYPLYLQEYPEGTDDGITEATYGSVVSAFGRYSRATNQGRYSGRWRRY